MGQTAYSKAWADNNKEHISEYTKQRRKQNPDTLKAQDKAAYERNKQKRLEYRRNKYANERWKIMASDAKVISKKKDIPYDLDADYIKSIWPADNCCPIFGTPFADKANNGFRDHTASLDKIKPVLGYIKGNVQVISFKANRIKSNATTNELLILASYMNKHFPEGN